MEASALQIGVIIVAGLVGGFLNTLAGGGSFITLAALEFSGLGSTMANGTNRIAIEVQNIMAVLGFRSKGVSNFRLSIQFAIPALLGAILGTYAVINLPTTAFHRVLAVAMLAMLVVMLIKPERWLKNQIPEMTSRRRILGYVVFFLLGVYGGAIQAGIGILLILALVLMAGFDLLNCNSHKVFIIATYTTVSLLMFALNGQVNWILGPILAVGNGIGAWVASRMAVSKGNPFIRIIMMLMLAILAIKYMDLIPWL